jgi:hypothetical protein
MVQHGVCKPKSWQSAPNMLCMMPRASGGIELGEHKASQLACACAHFLVTQIDASACNTFMWARMRVFRALHFVGAFCLQVKTVEHREHK